MKRKIKLLSFSALTLMVLVNINPSLSKADANITTKNPTTNVTAVNYVQPPVMLGDPGISPPIKY